MDTDYYRRLFHGAKEACEDWKYRCWILEAITFFPYYVTFGRRADEEVE